MKFNRVGKSMFFFGFGIRRKIIIKRKNVCEDKIWIISYPTFLQK